jgi:hypothetical protein
LTTVVAVLLGLLGTSARHLVIGAVLLIWLNLLPVVFLVGALFARGNLQAFCVGAVIPNFTMLFTGALSYGVTFAINSETAAIGAAFGIWITTQIASLLCGSVAVLAKRWIDRNPDVKLPFLDR